MLKEAEAGAKTKELCRRHGISEATFYNWKARFAGMTVSEARRLKELEVHPGVPGDRSRYLDHRHPRQGGARAVARTASEFFRDFCLRRLDCPCSLFDLSGQTRVCTCHEFVFQG